MGQSRFNDLQGKRFGKLLVIERASKTGDFPIKWLCKCDCGSQKQVISANLTNATTKSCGCLRSEMSSKRFKTHGMTRTRTYRIWSQMKTRCLNSQQDHYRHYGGRGIKICERWMKFENFLDDMGIAPKGMSLDRIDVNGDYEPKNCKWSTPKEQASNKRKVVHINIDDLKTHVSKLDFLTQEQKEKVIASFLHH